MACPARPKAAARDHHRLGVMRQPVQPGRGEQRIAEQVWPLGWRTVTGQEDAANFVPFINHVIEIGGRRVAAWLEPEIVEHEQVRPQIHSEPLFPGAVGAATMDVLQHFVGVDEQHLKPLPTRFVG
jgi:hypothetical protein